MAEYLKGRWDRMLPARLPVGDEARPGDAPEDRAQGDAWAAAWRLIPFAFGLLAIALLLTRLPTTLLTIFWAEDGHIFYAQAYNQGSLRALFIPYTGYLQTFPRLEAALAVHFPLVYGPLLAAGVALVADVLPGMVFLSSRFDRVLPSRLMRLVLATISVILPSSWELNGNLANVQWHLVLLSFLLLIGRPPRTLVGHLADLAALVVGALSGPFCIFLAPIAAWMWLRERERWRLWRVAVLGATAVLQAAVLLFHYGEREGRPLNPNAGWFVRALDRPLLAPLIGDQRYLQLVHTPVWHEVWLPALVLLVGALAIAYVAWRGPSSLRWFLVVAAGILTMAMSVGGKDDPPQGHWAGIAGAVALGVWRYYYVPQLAWITVLIWLVLRSGWLPVRALAVSALAVGLLVAVPSDWRYPLWWTPPSSFYASAQHFDQAPPGTTVTLPINFQPFWFMTLTKR
jgi:hypothetical protein